MVTGASKGIGAGIATARQEIGSGASLQAEGDFSAPAKLEHENLEDGGHI
jgi:NAD(P)-dependent dehydrogenase (short-subunit alcohol dehydrogenase family)